ncbi:MAG: hypothetical protein RBS39_07110 [Phycisphaerales bacterium]|jgi:hypothetical protein|nr:hypothetical protein [Phycisphaerales bacterium]
MARYTLDDIPNSVRLIHGLPQPDWSVIQPWIEARRQSKDELLYDSVAADWLLRLADAMEPGLPVFEYPGLFVLIGPGVSGREEIAEQIERTYRLIGERIRLRRPDGVLHPGKSAAICFGSDDHYYSYLAAHYPEGEHIASSGVQIRDGFCHVVVNWSTSKSIHVFAHEFVHLHVYGMELPLWMEEGLAQYFECIDSNPLATAFELGWRDTHRKAWSGDRIQAFWDGTAFGETEGETSRMAYQLSFLLVRAIVSRWPRRVVRWIENARCEDAGAVATKSVLGQDLEKLVAGLLGPGAWTPNLQDMQVESDEAERR